MGNYPEVVFDEDDEESYFCSVYCIVSLCTRYLNEIHDTLDKEKKMNESLALNGCDLENKIKN